MHRDEYTHYSDWCVTVMHLYTVQWKGTRHCLVNSNTLCTYEHDRGTLVYAKEMNKDMYLAAKFKHWTAH